MRVVIPVLSLDYGGERVIVEVANGLTSRGHEVLLVVPYGCRIAWPVHASLIWVPALTPACIPPCDIVMPNFYPTVMPAFQSRRGRCVRLSLGFEPLWIDKPEAIESYGLPIPVIVISEWQRGLVQKLAGPRTYLLHPGVDPAAFHPYPKPDDGVLRVLYLLRTRHYHWKGQNDFAAAHEWLIGRFPNLQVMVVQGGANHGEGQYPLPCVWRSAGDDRQMGRIYAEADILVYPSRFESFGLPPLEAMACGTATVIGDCGGVREYARHLENCLLVEPGNPAALASTTAALLADAGARQRLVEGGLRTAAAWTWQRTYQEIEAILREILAG
ncbi:MAG: glycosyltransferase family 4 protein [Patescibacteria group bacterium]